METKEARDGEEMNNSSSIIEQVKVFIRTGELPTDPMGHGYGVEKK